MDTATDPKPTVALLGTGRMGEPMGRRLLAAGFPLRAWNRTIERARPLEEDGATIATTPAEAATGADVLLTMLADGAATQEAVTGESGALSALQPGSIWIQMGTIGLEWTNRLSAAAGERGIWFVDAPVSGSDGPAREGKLVILAAFGSPDDLGAESRPWLQAQLEPIFQAIGRRTIWLSPIGQGSALKLVLNAWLAVLTEQTAEAVAFAEALGLDPKVLVDTLADVPLGAPYAILKANAMIAHQYSPGFALRHAHKDVELAKSAASDRAVSLPLLNTVDGSWEEVIEAGHGDEDVAVVIEGKRAAAAG
jgi:3-hydroxyisobutyrate dehydrogenase